MHKETNVRRCVKVLRKSVMKKVELAQLSNEIKIMSKLVSKIKKPLSVGLGSP